MIADTTFLSDYHSEHERGVIGPARRFMARQRQQIITTVVTVGELAVIFDTGPFSSRTAFCGSHRKSPIQPVL